MAGAKLSADGQRAAIPQGTQFAYYDVVRNGGGMAFSTYFDRRVLRVLEDDFSPTFTVELMDKDVNLAAAMAGPKMAKTTPAWKPRAITVGMKSAASRSMTS